ncbi:hypothetical protein FHS72_003273 [Loktanella ponticola]|uniref:DUF2793 domain-containing protein n=1 Tax=Yoonia ponticola TaxID=1524255 RepID=A0A7W9BN87_9RHOB|nr:DUF2793 domain-containing protein [Yoonia ponticola]MBB5723628.1 hypothetical protein [Yoonia ponticola]
MSQTSPHLNLPYIQPAQAQKHVTHNEAIELLDMIVQLSVQGFDASTPPAAPSDGETWAIGTAPTGAWTDQAGKIASFRGGGWLFITPQTGWQAYDATAGEMRVYSGVNWQLPSFDNMAGIGINAVADATNKLSVASEAVLFNHAGAGHQLKLNKASTTDTASLLFQSNWSGRAEMGLAGSDDFAVKVSDGATWFTGLTVTGATGAVQINEVLSLPPRTEPASGTAGDVYFDSASAKLRCFDGTIWQDLF